MTLLDLLIRIRETTSLNIITPQSLGTCVANCFADLTSRGYRFFKEKEINLTNPEELKQTNTSFILDKQIQTEVPKDLRKLLYVKVIFENNVLTAKRVSPSSPEINNRVKNGIVYTEPVEGAIVYRKENILVIETSYSKPLKIVLGYNAKLTAPDIPDDEESLPEIEIDMRPEFEDALVFYGCYFYFMRGIENQETTQAYLNQYKYYVEDILHELGHEDSYYEGETIIKDV